MKMLFRIAAFVLVATGWLQTLAHGQPVSLDFLTKPTLVECEPEEAEPCFRMKFDFVDATGKPVSVQLPSAEQLASHVEVQIEGQTVAVLCRGDCQQRGQRKATADRAPAL